MLLLPSYAFLLALSQCLSFQLHGNRYRRQLKPSVTAEHVTEALKENPFPLIVSDEVCDVTGSIIQRIEADFQCRTKVVTDFTSFTHVPGTIAIATAASLKNVPNSVFQGVSTIVDA